MTDKGIFQLDHHIQKQLCYTRPSYRQGRKFTAIKVTLYLFYFLYHMVINIFPLILPLKFKSYF
jgi:hypothetical protein